jgi:cytochrome c biogenesis protein CcmG/thiol:disulfide interchange protein DsbE
VRFLGVDHGDRRSPARAYLRRNGVDYPSVVDDSGALLSEYGANGLPITYVIDRDGRIRYEAIGLVDPASLRHAVDRVRAG